MGSNVLDIRTYVDRKNAEIVQARYDSEEIWLYLLLYYAFKSIFEIQINVELISIQVPNL